MMATLQANEKTITPQASEPTPFYDTVRQRAVHDPEFRAHLLTMGAEAVLAGELEESKAALRTYIKCTVGYAPIADIIGVHPKSLIRMLSPNGNPRASSLVSILAQTAKLENVQLSVKASRRSPEPHDTQVQRSNHS